MRQRKWITNALNFGFKWIANDPTLGNLKFVDCFSSSLEVYWSLTIFQKFPLLRSPLLKLFPDPLLPSYPFFLPNYNLHSQSVPFKVLVSLQFAVAKAQFQAHCWDTLIPGLRSSCCLRSRWFSGICVWFMSCIYSMLKMYWAPY